MVLLALVALGVGVIAATALLAAGRLGELPPVPIERPGAALPSALLNSHDVREAQFGVTFRGYRMAEVDDFIERVAGEYLRREQALLSHSTDTASSDFDYQGYPSGHGER